MKAIIYRSVMEDIEIEVTSEEIERGFTEIECGACQGTGVFAANPEYGQPCVECSTRGTRVVTL